MHLRTTEKSRHYVFSSLLGALLALGVGAQLQGQNVEFKRGFVNWDDVVDLSDVIMILGRVFVPDPENLNCEKAADTNGDGILDLSDAIVLLGFLFFSDPLEIPAPFADCGFDPSSVELTCESFPQCEGGPVPPQDEVPEFELSFGQVPETLMGEPGEKLTFEASVLLTTSNNPTVGTDNERGAQGWQLSLGIEGKGANFLSATVSGTAADEIANTLPPNADEFVFDFFRTEVVGWDLVSVGLLPFGNFSPPPSPPPGFAVELPPEGALDLLKLTVECTVPQEGCADVSLSFLDGKQFSGGGPPVKNNVTFRGNNIPPETTDATCQCCRGHRLVFQRGKVNGDNLADISDSIAVFGWLFLGEPANLSCEKSADTNDDGVVDIADGIRLLGHLFLPGGEAPPAPFSECGTDPTPDPLGCQRFTQCE